VKATVRATGQGGIFVHDDTAHDLMAGWGVIGSTRRRGSVRRRTALV
jgi:hypothetical protein